jgi:hypothetical protein
MNSNARLDKIIHQIDEHTERQAVTAAEPLHPPAFGQPHADHIGSVVDGITQDISLQIDGLRKTLDEIEQTVLAGAERAKRSLLDQVIVCVRVNDEIAHMREVIAELAVSAAER